MTVYTDEVNIYNAGAIQDGIDDAAGTATSYIFKTTGHDAWVCDEDAGPNPATGEAYGPNATKPTTGWRIGSVFELVKQGVSWFKLWVENSTAKLRIGRADSGHTVLDSTGMEVFKNASSSVAKFGATSRVGEESGAHIVQTGTSTTFYNDDGATEGIRISTHPGESGQSDPHAMIEAPLSPNDNSCSIEMYDSLESGYASNPRIDINAWCGNTENSNADIYMLCANANKYSALWVTTEDLGSGADLIVAPNSVVADADFAAKRIGFGNSTDSGVYGGLSASGDYIYFWDGAPQFDGSAMLWRFSKATSGIYFHDGTSWKAATWNAQASRTANTVLAAPNGSSGTASFRKLVADDISGFLSTDEAFVNTDTDKSISASTWTDIGSVTLAAGTWLVVLHTAWDGKSPSQGVLAHTFATSVTAPSSESSPLYGTLAVAAANQRMTTMGIVHPSSSTKYHFICYQSSGGSLTLRARRGTCTRLA